MEWLAGFVPMLIVVAWLFGDQVLDIINTWLGRPGRRHLTRKQARALQRRADQHAAQLWDAADILRDVQASDRVVPQLPVEVRQRVDQFVATFRQSEGPKALPPGDKQL